jgi:hypothetical protein
LDSTVVILRFGFDRERGRGCHAPSQLGQLKPRTMVMIKFPPWLDVAAPLEASQRTADAREPRAKLEAEPARSTRFVWWHEQATKDRGINPTHAVEFTIDVDLRCCLVTHPCQDQSVAMIEHEPRRKLPSEKWCV